MTYEQLIDRAVREACEQGRPLLEVIHPLLNMAASTLANVVIENKLDAAEEIDVQQKLFEDLYEQYLVAYLKQNA